jgi:hypothetical protein
MSSNGVRAGTRVAYRPGEQGESCEACRWWPFRDCHAPWAMGHGPWSMGRGSSVVGHGPSLPPPSEGEESYGVVGREAYRHGHGRPGERCRPRRGVAADLDSLRMLRGSIPSPPRHGPWGRWSHVHVWLGFSPELAPCLLMALTSMPSVRGPVGGCDCQRCQDGKWQGGGW